MELKPTWPNRRLPWSVVTFAELGLDASLSTIKNELSNAGTAVESPGLLSTMYRWYFRLGLYRYSLGFPVEDMHHCFGLAAKAFVLWFPSHTGLRALAEKDPAARLATGIDDHFKPLRDTARIANSYLDFAAVSSAECITHLQLALSANNFQLASQIAALIGSVPNEVETRWVPEVYARFANALKGYFGEGDDAAIDAVERVRCKPSDVFWKSQIDMLHGIASQDNGLFLEGVQTHLQWHTRLAKRSDKASEAEIYISLPATALSMLALQKGLITTCDLPDSVHLPLQLSEFADFSKVFSFATTLSSDYT